MIEERSVRVLDKLIVGIAIVMGLYHLVSTQYLVQSPHGHYTTHLMFCLLIIFLTTLRTAKKRSFRLLILVLLLSGLVATVYINFNLVPLEYRAGFPNTVDFILGIILVVVVMEGTRQVWGMTLPLVGTGLLLYFFFGMLSNQGRLPSLPFHGIWLNTCECDCNKWLQVKG